MYGHADGDCAVIGGSVYRGLRWPALTGVYFFGDFCSSRIRSLRRENGQWVSGVALRIDGETTTFGEDEQGEIYVGSAGAIFRIDAVF